MKKLGASKKFAEVEKEVAKQLPKMKEGKHKKEYEKHKKKASK